MRHHLHTPPARPLTLSIEEEAILIDELSEHTNALAESALIKW